MLNNVAIKKLVITLILLLTTALMSAQEFIGSTEKPYVRTMTITPSNINNLPKTIETNCVYKFDLFTESDEYSVCKIDVWNEKEVIGKSIIIPADENNHFVQKFYLPVDSTKAVLSMKKKGSSSFEEIKIFSLTNAKYKETPAQSFDEKTGANIITVDYTNLKSLPQSVKRGELYIFDVCLEESDFGSCFFQNIYNEEKIKSNEIFTKQPNGHFVKTFIVPSSLKTLNICVGNGKTQDNFVVMQCSGEGSSKPAVLKTPAHYMTAQNYRHRNADEKMGSFLSEFDVEKICRKNPDKAIEIIIQKICEWTDDEFEKVMFIHDAICYLLDFDLDTLEKDVLPFQDYYSALTSGVTGNEGFVNTFSQMCYAAGIPCVKVYGESTFPREFNIQSGYHVWNIVKIKNYWYLTDITWDCSHVSEGKRDGFYTSTWMFVTPKMFIKTHYPEFREYQLLEKPYIRKELIK